MSKAKPAIKRSFDDDELQQGIKYVRVSTFDDVEMAYAQFDHELAFKLENGRITDMADSFHPYETYILIKNDVELLKSDRITSPYFTAPLNIAKEHQEHETYLEEMKERFIGKNICDVKNDFIDLGNTADDPEQQISIVEISAREWKNTILSANKYWHKAEQKERKFYESQEEDKLATKAEEYKFFTPEEVYTLRRLEKGK